MTKEPQVKVFYYVAHCLFLPERVAHLAKMKASFPAPLRVSASEVAEHASVWARRMWQKAAEEDLGENPPDWHVFFNDDIDICPDPRAFEAALSVAESDIVAFHTSCTDRTDIRFARCYWMTGPGYAFRRGHAAEMLTFYDFLPKDFSTKLGNNEDIVGILNAWSRQQPIWSTIPALVQHRTDIPSTLGYDNHPLRQSAVPWTLEAFKGRPLHTASYWADPNKTEPPFIENPWMPSLRLTQQWHGIKSQKERELAGEPQQVMCAFCVERPLMFKSEKTGAGLCKVCLCRCVVSALEMLK